MTPAVVHKNNTSFLVQGSEDAWIALEKNLWEDSTFKILDKVLKPEYTILDLGAWIGPISLYAASKVKKCFSFEPDPVAFQEFSANLLLNPELRDKIEAINCAVTPDGAPIKLFSRYAFGDSGSSFLKRVKSTNQFVTVPAITFTKFLKQYGAGKIQFIKMDIEGGEFMILPQMFNYLSREKPSLLISFHFEALCEYYELKYMRLGAMRRVYRFLDPARSIIGKFAIKKIQQILSSLAFYKMYDSNLLLINPENLSKDFCQKIDMILFSTDEIN